MKTLFMMLLDLAAFTLLMSALVAALVVASALVE